MELRQLACLVTVTDEASFTRAAARLHLAQPGVSAQVRRLERELGQPLLDRTDRHVRPTQVGAAIIPHARAALAAAAEVRRAVEEHSGLVRGRVTVAMVTGCASVKLPAALAQFHAAHPGVEITLSEAGSDQMLDQLRTGTLDLGLIGLADQDPDGVDTQVIVDEPIVAAVAPSHELARRTTITLDALAEHALVTLPPGTGLRTALDAACQARRLTPRIAFEASDPNVLARLASTGLGVAILAHSMAAAQGDELWAITIARPRLRAQLALAWNANRPASPAARALLTHTRQTLAQPPTRKARRDHHPAG